MSTEGVGIVLPASLECSAARSDTAAARSRSGTQVSVSVSPAPPGAPPCGPHRRRAGGQERACAGVTAVTGAGAGAGAL